MKKQTISIQPVQPSLIQGVKSLVTAKITAYTKLINSIIKTELTNKEVLKLTHAYVAFFSLLLSPAFNSIALIVIMFIWFATSLYSAKELNNKLENDDSDI